MTATDQRSPAVTAAERRPGSAGLDHERLRAALDDLPGLLRIADLARYFSGPGDCAEGECEHIGEAEQCPLLAVRYATADDLDRLHDAVTILDRVHELALRGLAVNPAVGLELFAQIVDLAATGARLQEAP
jgi:hypothetical protein